MASSTKRAWKLQEFVAHGGNVNCLALAHKTARVIVTGGEDKKVNMWAVEKPNCIMSLSGHTSPVEAVRFDHAEEMVVAGSLSGALKIWDLQAAKILRTLTGHKSSIKSLDFHPYGDFVASGSMDSNIKLWDIRRKGCIFAYKGHTGCINSLRFSPDGRWVASAGEDGILKLWDLSAGKLLTDFKGHTAAVTSVEFHPNEFLLASGSADKTIRFWDLESFNLISSTDGESTGIRAISFHSEGSCVYAGCQDSMKVYGWEPTRSFDSLPVGWGRVSDIAMANNQLIGATFSQANVSTFVVDIKRVQPFGGPPAQPNPSPPKSASGRRSFILDRPHTQSSRKTENSSSIPKEEPQNSSPTQDDPGDDSASPAEIQDPDKYWEVFQSKSRVSPSRNHRTQQITKKLDPPSPKTYFPTRLTRSPSRSSEPFPAPDDDVPPPPVVVHRNPPAATPISGPPTNQNRAERDHSTGAAPPPARQPTAAPPSARQHTAAPSPRQPTAAPSQARQPTAAPSQTRQPTAAPSQRPSSSNPPEGGAAEPSSARAERLKPVGLNVDDFLPKPMSPSINNQSTPSDISETEAVSSIMKGHDYMSKVMNSRLRNLQIVRALWSAGNTKTAMDSAISMNDLPVIVDLLNVMVQKSSLWSLDLCAMMAPQLTELMNSKYDNYVETGCETLKLILRDFASVIKANMTAPPSVGVDISREERYHKCRACYKALASVRSAIDQKHTAPGKMAHKFREIQLLMSQLD